MKMMPRMKIFDHRLRPEADSDRQRTRQEREDRDWNT